MSAKTAWTAIAADFPANGSVTQKLAHVLKVVTRTSAQEDWHPCQYKLKDDCIELFAPLDPSLEVDDPEGRRSMTGCGEALFRLRLTLKHFGCLGAMELFPDLSHTRHVARVHYGGWHISDSREDALYEALTGSTRNLTPFDESLISETSSGALKQAIASENAWLEFAHTESSRSLLSELTHAGQQTVTVVHEESGRTGFSLGESKNSRTSWWSMPFSRNHDRHDWSGKHSRPASPRPGDEMAALGALKTKTDDKSGWLAAGLTRAYVQLQAQASGVPVTFYDQPFQKKFLREELRTAIGRKGFVQNIVGLGLRSEDWRHTASTQPGITLTFRR